MKRLRRVLLVLCLCLSVTAAHLLPVSASMEETGGAAHAVHTDSMAEEEKPGRNEAEEREEKEETKGDDNRTEVPDAGADLYPETEGEDGKRTEKTKEDTDNEKSDSEKSDGEKADSEKTGGQTDKEQAGSGTVTEEPDDSRPTEKSEEEKEAEKEAVLERTAGPDGVCFDIQSDIGRFLRSVDNGSSQQVNSVRFDKFYTEVGLGTSYNPQLAMGIKYIDHDNETPDADGKWRYVYCLNFNKSSPTGQLLTYKGGWTNRKIAYCLYYGAMFWKQPCRYPKYRTGDWQLDYFVTQVAVHVLNGEFTLSSAFGQIDDAAGATADEKALAKDRINKLVNDANDGGNYASFTGDGWFDASAQATFSITTPSDFAAVTDGYATGYSTPTFKTAYDLDMKEQITGFNVTTTNGVNVQKKDTKTYSDFRLFIKTAQYKSWQLTGKTVSTTVKATAPKWWGGGIYTAPSGSEYQDCVLWTYTTAGGSFTKTASFDKEIPKKTFTLNIQKKDAETGAGLTGAVFSLWAYDGSVYSKKLGTFTDKGGGKYSYTGIDYTKTKDGWFLIKEDKPPKDYHPEYVIYNNADKENYVKHGGREVKLTVDGFEWDGVPDGAIFKDNPVTPKADIAVKKTDADTGEILEGAGFQVREWDKTAKAYKKTAYRTLKYDTVAKRYVTEKPVERTDSNEGKFKVIETKLPNGYQCPWEKEIEITEKRIVTLNLEAVNYPERNLTIHKKIQVDEITWAHGNPTFLFSVNGVDIDGEEHSYHRIVEFTKDYVEKHQTDGYVTLGTTITGIPAGEYKVMEDTPVMRYILTDAVAGSGNVSVIKNDVEKINGFMKIQADVSADLRPADGNVTFENHKTHFDKVSHNSTVINVIK